MLEQIINKILFRGSRARKAAKRLLECIESEAMEDFLKLLLKAMNLFFIINKDFRKNIDGFEGRYAFKTRDNSITVSAIFEKGRMKIFEKVVDYPNVTVNFRNARNLRNYLLSPKPDILGSLLKQDVVPEGNLNYVYKFAFMAKRLQLIALGKA